MRTGSEGSCRARAEPLSPRSRTPGGARSCHVQTVGARVWSVRGPDKTWRTVGRPGAACGDAAAGAAPAGSARFPVTGRHRRSQRTVGRAARACYRVFRTSEAVSAALPCDGVRMAAWENGSLGCVCPGHAGPQAALTGCAAPRWEGSLAAVPCPPPSCLPGPGAVPVRFLTSPVDGLPPAGSSEAPALGRRPACTLALRLVSVPHRPVLVCDSPGGRCCPPPMLVLE